MSEQDILFEKFKKIREGTDSSNVVGEEAGVMIPIKRKRSSNLPLALLLLFIVLFAIGYYLIAVAPSSDSDMQPVSASMPQKLPIPERISQIAPIKEVIVEQSPVVETLPVVTTEKPVVETLPVVTTEKPVVETLPVVTVTEIAAEKKPVASAAVAVIEPAPAVLYSVLVGPFITKTMLDTTIKQLRGLGFDPQQAKGKGLVTMIRLLEGVYPEATARQRFDVIKKKAGDAFMLPAGDKLAVYVGSFSDSERAASYADQLAEKGIEVSLVANDIEMSGKMLLAVQADQQTARQVAELIGRSGLKTQVVRK